jgi:hypothetical protein
MSGVRICYFDEGDQLTGHRQMTDRLGVFQQLAAHRATSRMLGYLLVARPSNFEKNRKANRQPRQ